MQPAHLTKLKDRLNEVERQAGVAISTGRYLPENLSETRARKDVADALHELGLAVTTLTIVVREIIDDLDLQFEFTTDPDDKNP